MDPTVVDSLPEDRSYLEWDLPDDLVASIERLRASWKKKDAGERCTEWDLDYCELQSDITAWRTKARYHLAKRITYDMNICVMSKKRARWWN